MHRARRRSQTGLVLAAAVIIAAGFGIGLVEMYRWPKGSIWGVVGVAVLLISIIRTVSTRKP
jgi:thiamine transporter ThiT